MGFYRVKVLTTGEYGNVVLGCRYTFSRRNAKNLLRFFMVDCKCQARVEKFRRSSLIGEGWWGWLRVDKINDAIFDEVLEKGIRIY